MRPLGAYSCILATSYHRGAKYVQHLYFILFKIKAPKTRPKASNMFSHKHGRRQTFCPGGKGGGGRGRVWGADNSHEKIAEYHFCRLATDHCGRYDIVFSTVALINY